MVYIRRHLEARLREAAEDYPVVTVTGPRQSGKTTLLRHVFEDADYVNLESPLDREFALEDPKGFLARFNGQVIIDEAQRVPDLFSWIQVAVDADGRSGRYILSGSQNFLILRSIGQSLAGRCSILHLLPLSRAELAGERPLDLGALGESFREPPGSGGDLFEMLHRGGYPRIHERGLDAQEWCRNYYQSYIERDVREVLNVGDIEAFSRFVSLCAGRVGQLLDLSSLGNDCGISHTTARRWLSVLEASFVAMRLTSHHRNFSKRLIKSPKLYFLDTGLLCYLLRIRSPEDLQLHAARGAIFESWVISEAAKHYANHGREADLSFWRDSSGNEVDLVIEEKGDLRAIEIKSGQTFQSDFLKGLKKWRCIADGDSGPNAVIYGGDDSYARDSIAICSWRVWG